MLLLSQFCIDVVNYFVEVRGSNFGGDFIVFWTAAHLLGQGDIAHIYDTTIIDQAIASLESMRIIRPFVYPPYALFLLWPLRDLDYNDAVALWSVLPLPFYFGLVLLLSKQSLSRYGDLLSQTKLCAVICAFMLPALAANIFTGQSAAFIALAFLAAGWCWTRYPVLAGICIGLVAIKPQLGLLMPFALIAARQWRIVASATLTIITMAAAATLWLGASIWTDYLHMTQHFGIFLDIHADYFAKLGMSTYTSLQALRVTWISPPIAAVAQAVVTLSLAVFIFRLFRDRDPGRHDLRFGMLACSALLATPYTLCYDAPLLAAAVIPLLARIWHRGVNNVLEIITFAAFVAMPFAQPMFAPWHVPFGLISNGLLLLVLWRHYRQEKAEIGA